MGARAGRSTSRGFTLIELVIVIAVIGILAALLIPTILGVVERSRRAAAKEQIAELAKTMKRFHDDTGYWPRADSVWVPQPGGSPQIDPAEFSAADTVMFASNPPDITSISVNGESLSPIPHCKDARPGYSCFNGPYLGAGDSLGGRGMLDPWGNPLRYTYIRPFDGGGGSVNFPQGFVAIWSAGPDRKDATGCFGTTTGAKTAGCAYDLVKISQGQSSIPSDDEVRFVGSAL
jgi:prepilin-type N-terminal cleavage/methylation domain-containing protein